MSEDPRANVVVAVVQAALAGHRQGNVERVEALVREAAAGGARVVLPPELFEGPYFPKVESDEFFAWARPVEGNATIERFRALAAELAVVDCVPGGARDARQDIVLLRKIAGAS